MLLKIINFINKFIVLIFFLLTINFSLFAGLSSLEVSFFGGLSVPNNHISNFFNAKNIAANVDSFESIGTFIENSATNLGYNLGMKVNAPISSNLNLYGGIAVHRFNKGKYTLSIPEENTVDTAFADFYSTANIVPITVGITAYLIKYGIGIYLMGDISYNFISTSVDYKVKNKITLPLSLNKTETRPGCGLGAGIDFDIGLFILALEVKYNLLNVVGRVDNEPTKNYANVSLGVTF